MQHRFDRSHIWVYLLIFSAWWRWRNV